MTKQAINQVYDNLNDVIRLMDAVAMIGLGNTTQHVQGDEVSGLLSHFTERLESVVKLVADLTPTTD